MQKIYQDITEIVGNTPLVRLNHIASDLKATILVKVESRNPAFSVKDRIALGIIRAAEASGELKPGGTIVEATSGNTGIGIAALGTALGYKVVLVMPASMSQERKILLRAYGAELVLITEGGMAGAVKKAEEIAASREGSILAKQFENEANPLAHYQYTGPEIWQATEGKVDALVAGFGTGGTISGAGKYLKEQNPQINLFAVEPKESPLVSSGQAAPHKIQGIGANFIPRNLDQNLLDEVLTVTGERAIEISRLLAQKEGLLVGISAGANVAAALEIASREEFAGKTIVTVLPDTGERYLSTELYAHLAD